MKFRCKISSPVSALQQGFTLLELSIVLAIIAVILSGGLAIFTNSLQSTQYNATVAKMDAIEAALLNFSLANNRIPCPSDLTQIVGSTTYGVQAANQGSCTGGTPAANHKTANGTIEGGVPTRALQLPDDYMYDAWGRRFRYAVDPLYTVTNTLPAPAGCLVSASATALTVKDSTGAARTHAAIYVLLSHGQNGHGGYTSTGSPVNAGSTNTNEQTNCHCNSSAVATAYSASYVEQAPTLSTASAVNSFDDIVTFKEAWQMQKPNAPLAALTAANCPQILYSVDRTDFRVEVFNTNGSYLRQFGSSGTGNGQFSNPYGVTVDASGYVWVADTGNNRVEEFDAYGNYLQQFGTSGSGNGQFNAPHSVAVDSGGNIWVADASNNRVQKFNRSGTWMASLGGTSTACTNCLCTGPSACPTSSGGGNGQLNTPDWIAFDSSGNIWVSDNNNDRVDEFNSSGTYLNKFGGCCFSNGQMHWNAQMAIDGSGNIWVVDGSNNRLEQFNSSGSYLQMIPSSGCTSGNNPVCPASASPGQFNIPMGLVIDASGNLWVSDGNNYRLQELNSSGSSLNSYGSHGNGNGQFEGIAGLAISAR